MKHNSVFICSNDVTAGIRMDTMNAENIGMYFDLCFEEGYNFSDPKYNAWLQIKIDFLFHSQAIPISYPGLSSADTTLSPRSVIGNHFTLSLESVIRNLSTLPCRSVVSTHVTFSAESAISCHFPLHQVSHQKLLIPCVQSVLLYLIF